MMWRSKDHRSAGLWWSLSPSGGGHDRFLKSLLGLIIISSPSWCCRGLICAEVHRDPWTKKIPSWLLIIISFRFLSRFQPWPHPLVRRFADRHFSQWCRLRSFFCGPSWTVELAVDHLPVDHCGGDQLSLPHFLGFGCCGGSFSSGHLPCLMVNGEDHSHCNDQALEM
uniref:Uncharacterized protein n=1 Tax=Fagus sylvatica TaxID=28930 RepID=A0A2N9HYU9_FAGSY